jgi:hypothetical protein
MPVDKQPYGPDAGDAAVQAAHDGNLRLQDVSFAYPLRPNSGGEVKPAVYTRCQPKCLLDLASNTHYPVVRHCCHGRQVNELREHRRHLLPSTLAFCCVQCSEV